MREKLVTTFRLVKQMHVSKEQNKSGLLPDRN